MLCWRCELQQISSRDIVNLFTSFLVYTFFICLHSLGRKQFLQNWNHSNSLYLYWLLDTQVSNMNKRIRTDPHCFVSIVGPCGSGNTQLVSNMLLNQGKIFRPSFDKILYLYNHHQSNFDKLLVDCTRAKVHNEFRQGLDWTAVEKCEAQKLRTLLVIDDLYKHVKIIFF